MSARRAQFGHFVGLGAHGVAGLLTAVVRGAGKRSGAPRGRCRPGSGHGDARDGALRSAAGRGSEGGGEAEAAQEGVEVFPGIAVEGDRGPRAGDDRGQGIAERGPARIQAGPVTARGEAAERGRGVRRRSLARARRRRSQPRTVAGGTPSSAPSRALPVPCRAAAAAARAITPAPSARRGAIQDGSSMWVASQDRHRPRGGAATARSPRCSRTARSRPRPHGPRRPRPHDGHRSEPETRSALADSASAQSSTGQSSPGHAPMIGPGPHGPPGAARVARSQPGRRPATRTPAPPAATP